MKIFNKQNAIISFYALSYFLICAFIYCLVSLLSCVFKVFVFWPWFICFCIFISSPTKKSSKIIRRQSEVANRRRTDKIMTKRKKKYKKAPQNTNDSATRTPLEIGDVLGWPGRASSCCFRTNLTKYIYIKNIYST